MKKTYIHLFCLSMVSALGYLIMYGDSNFQGMALYILGMVITGWILFVLCARG